MLRYLARVQAGPDGRVIARVGPEAVDVADPAARLVGVEAYVAFTTARHAERPLVVQGAGVGGASTAGGVLAEILAIARGGAAAWAGADRSQMRLTQRWASGLG